MAEDRNDRAIRELGRRLAEALDAFEREGGRPCVPDCPCPMSEAIRGARWFISCLGQYDAGKLLAPDDALPLAYAVGVESIAERIADALDDDE